MTAVAGTKTKRGSMQARTFLSMLFALCAGTAAAAGVSYSEHDDYVPTHDLTPFGPLPTAQDANGVYPYVSYAETSRRPSLKSTTSSRWRIQLKVTVSPDLGGKVISMIHKGSGREVLYVPDVIRQTRILPRFYFIAGGIEVSFPIAHTPSQNENPSKLTRAIASTSPAGKESCALACNGRWSIRWGPRIHSSRSG